MSRVLTKKQRILLEDMGYGTAKIERKEKRKRDQKMKNERRKKRYFNG